MREFLDTDSSTRVLPANTEMRNFFKLMNRNTSARSSSVYKTDRSKRSLYKQNRRSSRSSRSGRSTDSSSNKKKNKKKSSAFLRRALLVSVSAIGAYLVYSIIEAENVGSLLEQILGAIRAALK